MRGKAKPMFLLENQKRYVVRYTNVLLNIFRSSMEVRCAPMRKSIDVIARRMKRVVSIKNEKKWIGWIATVEMIRVRSDVESVRFFLFLSFFRSFFFCFFLFFFSGEPKLGITRFLDRLLFCFRVVLSCPTYRHVEFQKGGLPFAYVWFIIEKRKEEKRRKGWRKRERERQRVKEREREREGDEE